MKKRVCRICGRTLSIYNNGNKCFSHMVPKSAKGPALFLEGVRVDRHFVKTQAAEQGTVEDMSEL